MRRISSLVAVLTLVLIVIGASAGLASPAPKKNKKKPPVDPLAAQSLMRQGYVFMQQQQYDQALERFREADKANPGNATVYNMVGLCYLSLQNREN